MKLPCAQVDLESTLPGPVFVEDLERKKFCPSQKASQIMPGLLCLNNKLKLFLDFISVTADHSSWANQGFASFMLWRVRFFAI